jgi:hypothetical protein
MAVLYLLIAYPRFCPDPAILWEHPLVLGIWLMVTAILMLGIREVLFRLRLHLTFIPFVIIPAVSSYILYFIYAASIIGNLAWESPPNFKQILPFLPHLFELGDNFGIPRPLVVLITGGPFLAFLIIFSATSKMMSAWNWSIRESFLLLAPSRRFVILLGMMVPLAALSSMLSSDPTIQGFWKFNGEPIETFFTTPPVFFAMSRERVFWVQKDQMVERKIRGHIPGVHNIFVFVVDALRADHLPSYGYTRPLTPFLSEFLPTANARQVDMALSTGLDTLTGTICLQASKEPSDVSQYNFTLGDYLADEGYKTFLILAGDHHWQLNHQAFGRKIDLFYDGSEHPGPGGACDDTLVVDEVANLHPDDGGYHYFYIHLLSVHPLGILNDKYLQYVPVRNLIIDNKPFLDDQIIAEIRNLYDDKILQWDDVMKNLLACLEQKGYLKDYIAVITADHGQLLGEKGKYGHGHFADIEAMRIPMIFFGSKPLPYFPESHFAVQIDIPPTLVEMAGLEVPSSWQGQSLLRPRENPWSYHLSPYSHEGQEGAVVYYTPERILKYSRTLEDFEGKPGELYDLEKDPQESTNLMDHFDPNFLGLIRSQALAHLTSY